MPYISPLEWPQLTVPDDHWEPSEDDSDDPTARLTAAIIVNGLPMHIEAWAAGLVDDVLESETGYPDDLDRLVEIAGCGTFRRITIRDRDYVLVAYPFC